MQPMHGIGLDAQEGDDDREKLERGAEVLLKAGHTRVSFCTAHLVLRRMGRIAGLALGHLKLGH